MTGAVGRPRYGGTGGVEWRRRTERGVGSMLMIGVMSVVLALSLAGVCIAGYLVAAHRARSAADLAALSGASAFAQGGDPCASAKANARSNDAHVDSCSQVGDAVDFVVTVEVHVRVGVTVPGLPRDVPAVAYAGSSDQGGSGRGVVMSPGSSR